MTNSDNGLTKEVAAQYFGIGTRQLDRFVGKGMP
jgi:hypothetical protein